MPTTTTSSRPSSVQWLIESRPPSLTWSRPAPPQANQPPLDLSGPEQPEAPSAAPNDRGIRVRTVKARWAARPRPGLPNAQDWSTMLALAIIQVLLGQRPAAQLNRWLADDVLVAISIHRRRNLRQHGRIVVPTALRSVHVQHPDAAVAEVAAHLVIDKQSAAMAFRLEAFGDRWMCTALELGVRWRRLTGAS